MFKTCLQPVSTKETQGDFCYSSSNFSRAQMEKKAVK